MSEVSKKWIEVNIHFDSSSENREVLLSFVKPFVESCKDGKLIESWHYFQEMCPENGPKPGEREIRLRFYGGMKEIDTVKAKLDSQLKRLIDSGESLITFYHFGNHGGSGDYVGEAGYWQSDWLTTIKQYQKGAELGLWFIESFPHPQTMTLERQQKISHLIINQLLIPHGNFHTSAGPSLNLDRGLYLLRVE